MQHAIALVGRRRGTQVVEPFPVDQVLGAHDASVRPRSGEIRRSGILALAAEHAVQPAVLMLGDPHVVDVGFLRADIGQLYRMIPEAETVHPAVAFRHRKKGLAVVSFYPGDDVVFPVPVKRAGVEHRVDAQPLHEIRVAVFVEIVFPEGRHMSAGEHRMHITVDNPVVKGAFFILFPDQLLVFFQDPCLVFLKHAPALPCLS